jgi:hypothetical protein
MGAEDQGSAARDPDREAIHEARNLHAVLQPDVLRPRRLWRPGRVAAVLRQSGEGPHARGGRPDCRDPPGKRSPEPLRQHGCRAPPPQLHARPHGGSGLHQRCRGGRGQEEADHPARGTVRAAVGRTIFPRRGSQGARKPLRGQAPVRERTLDPDVARRQPSGGSESPSTMACDESTSAGVSASRAATCSPKATRSIRFVTLAGIGR